MTTSTYSPRVLSIQSHIVSGYCGNKAATFPLQLLGFDVDVMNTVSFSNHTGYPSWTGEKATGEQLTKLYEGLQTNGLVEYTHILTGYIGSAHNLAAVSEIIEQLRSYGDPFFVLDPVMGDNGQLYVQPDVIPLYQKLMRLAKAITPNQFEAEILADKKITNVNSCLEVIDILHNAGVENVVITSVSLLPKDIAANAERVGSSGVSSREHAEGRKEMNDTNDEELSMYCVCSSRKAEQDAAAARIFAIEFPTYDGYFTGTGDLFSALLVARLDEALQTEARVIGHGSEPMIDQGSTKGDHHNRPALARACLKVVATMKAVVLRTYLAQKGIVSGGEGASVRSLDRTQASAAAVVKQCELRLIQSKQEIERPDEEGVEAIELLRMEK